MRGIDRSERSDGGYVYLENFHQFLCLGFKNHG